MTEMTNETGQIRFFANGTDTYCVTPGGFIWHIQSDDDLGGDDPIRVVSLPPDAAPCDELLTRGEIVWHLKRIELVGGGRLVEG